MPSITENFKEGMNWYACVFSFQRDITHWNSATRHATPRIKIRGIPARRVRLRRTCFKPLLRWVSSGSIPNGDNGDGEGWIPKGFTLVKWVSSIPARQGGARNRVSRRLVMSKSVRPFGALMIFRFGFQGASGHPSLSPYALWGGRLQ